MKLRCVLALVIMVLALKVGEANATLPPVEALPELTYVNVLHAMLRLDKLNLENSDYLDAYSMAAHCDVVAANFSNEFRWNQAREAIKKWVAQKKATLPLKLAVKAPIRFSRYDFDNSYFLFDDRAKLNKVNTFSVLLPNPASQACNQAALRLLPNRFEVITNNPVTLPGLPLTPEQAKDLADKFTAQGNLARKAYMRFDLEIQGGDTVGTTAHHGHTGIDPGFRVKATLNAIEFFSDPDYKNRFYYYVPL